MRRSFIQSALVLAVALALAGCGTAASPSPTAAPSGAPSTQAPATAAPTAAPAEKVVLNLLTGFTGGDRAAYEGLVKLFNDTHPNIEARMDIQPWDTIKTTTPAAFASGQGPDIVTPDYNPGTVLEYVKGGLILPLDEMFGTGEKQVDPAALPPAVLEGFSADGKIYAAPANLATLMVYYNKALYAAAGLTKPPSTMDEFRTYAKALTDKAKGQYGIALADHATIAMWPILIWADGGNIVGQDGCSMLDDPKTIAAVKSWADLIASDAISPVGLTGGEADNLIAAGKAAMEMNGPWATGVYTPAGIDYDVAPIPRGSAPQVTLAAAVPFVVNKATKNKDAALEFLAWWNGKDAQRYLSANSGFPPSRTDMADDPELAKNPWVPKFAAAVPYSRLYLAGVPNFSQVDEIFSTAIGRLTRGEPADAVLTDSAKQMDAVLGCK